MTFDTLPTAHGPRRATWPADGAERAIAAGTRRRRRRRAATGAGSLVLVGVLASAVVALGAGDDATVEPLGRLGITRRMTTDLKACTERQDARTTFPHVADAGYCVFVAGPGSVTIGRAETWTFRFCRRTGLGLHTVSFADRIGARFHISHVMGGAVASWGLSGESEWHDVVFTGGECREWSFTWDGRDDDGAVVPTGRYRITGTTSTIAFDPSHKPRGDIPAMAMKEITVLAPS